MPTAAHVGQAGLQGWRTKLADAVAPRVSARTPVGDEHVRAFIGATFFVLALVYVVKTARAAAARLRETE